MHVDFPQEKTPYDKLEELVVIAGDTGNGLLGTKFINKLKRKGHQVFAVDGNHEHYANAAQGRSQLQTETRFYELIDQSHQVVLPGGLLIVGVNGWYPVTDDYAWNSYMSDSRCSGLSGFEANHLAVAHAEAVLSALTNHDGPAIVVTHTSPCEDTLNPQFEGHFSNEWYWNPHMGDVLRSRSDQILVWCHGHTHAPSDKIVDGVRVVCNPRGYPSENPQWAPKTIEVVL